MKPLRMQKSSTTNLHYTDFVEKQNARNAKIRHTERNRNIEDLLTSKKTCPEESIYQLGTLESHASPKELFQIATEFMDEFHERFGKHVHILDWALHLDEGTPHIHERHVFDCENKYGEIAPQQEKALEALGFELPKPDKPLDAIVDDDMKTEALPQTNNIKTLVTLEDKIDIERKGQQSVQGTLYVRFACFGNGSLHALYDKSNGFYRRQLLLTTKEKPVGRVDDPFLIDKIRNEKEGILLWALEGLHRLIRNNYRFTISERTAANLKEAMEQGNDILGFLKSEDYFEIRQGAKCKSTDFYKVYERWCLDNLEKPLAASTFIHHLKDNQKSLGIVYDDKCIGTNRGFHNVDIDLFLPVDVPSPWD